MNRAECRRSRPALRDRLEARLLLAALDPSSVHHHATHTAQEHSTVLQPANVPGNNGEIIKSQFQANNNGEVGYQWWRLMLGGPLDVQSTTPNNGTSAALTSAGSESTGTTIGVPVNTGLIVKNQFNSPGFPTVGTQLKAVRAHSGLTIKNYDESFGLPTNLPGAPTNEGSILGGQFNDGGFGKIGVQAMVVSVRGRLTVANNSYVRGPDGRSTLIPTASNDVSAPLTSSPRPPVLSHATTNSGLILHSQFNDGAFGDVGIQMRRVRVLGSMGISAERLQIEPAAVAGASGGSGSTGTAVSAASETATPTNTGWVAATQFNDGGFGDNGFQWENIGVRGQVDIAKNNLEIQPESSANGPIDASNFVFGTGEVVPPITSAATTTPASSEATPMDSTASTQVASQQADPARAKTKPKPKPLLGTNDATNSGRLVASQFNDGGFGDVGAQWLDVKVRRGVKSVDNSLSIQPENTGQGQITLSDVAFPVNPSPPPAPSPGPLHTLAPDPPVVAHDGARTRPHLPKPTSPGKTDFAKNEATNSGIITGSQVNDGGFGDIGLQWAHVKVGGSVRLVHNSLSVQPEGDDAAGVSVSNVAYGSPDTSHTNPKLAVLPSLTIDPSQTSQSNGSTGSSNSHPHPVNKGVLINKQFPSPIKADVVAQWNHVYRNKGLVIVHNAILVNKIDPTSAPVQLNNIRFPGRIPPVTYLGTGSASSSSAGSGVGTIATKNTATNAGVIVKNQFNDGAFGDIGMQWRKVNVAGNVAVVHNELAVSVTGNNNGPVNVSNVTFNSGALDGPHVKAIVSPPIVRSQIPSPRPKLGNGNSDNVPTNSGYIKGGQFTSGGFGHVMLQWNKVGINGRVTIVDNILSVGVSGKNNGPVTISNVSFS